MPAKKTPNVTDTVKEMGDEIIHAGRNVWLAGLGVVATVDEQSREMFDQFVTKGRGVEKDLEKKEGLFAKSYGQAADMIKTAGKQVEDRVQKTTEKALHSIGVPTHGEIQTLIQRVDQLTRKVNTLK